MRILPWNISAVTHNFTPLRIHSRAESKNQFMPISSDWFVTPLQGIVFDLMNNLIFFLIKACTYGLQHIFSLVHVQYILNFGNQEIQTSFKLGQAQIIFVLKQILHWHHGTFPPLVIITLASSQYLHWCYHVKCQGEGGGSHSCNKRYSIIFQTSKHI